MMKKINFKIIFTNILSDIKKNHYEKLLLAVLLLSVFLLYVFNISINGFADNYYSSAVQAATQSWHAFFYAGLDSPGFISIDKPPFSIWVMAIFARIFGFSSFNMLLPNALAGVGTVYLVYKMVRRYFDIKSALIASMVMALTPVAVLMFRYNHPDSILVFLITASVYCFMKSLNKRPLTWLILVGLILGIAFNTKMAQALIILPVFMFVYFFASNSSRLKKSYHLALMSLVALISALWWPLVVYLTPAANRPYIGSTVDNNIWSLVFGFNGLSRLAGFDDFFNPTMNGYGGNIGLLRMFNNDFGPNIAWLLPFALVSLCVLLWTNRHKLRNDKKRLFIIVIGGWLVSHIIVFSFFIKIIHPYYSLVMLPPLSILIGIGLPVLWKQYNLNTRLKWCLLIALFLCGISEFVILSYDRTWLPYLKWITVTIITIICLCLSIRQVMHKTIYKNIAVATACILLFLVMIFYSFAGMSVSHSGSIPIPSPALIVVRKDSVLKNDSILVRYLVEHKESASWIAASISSADSSPIQIGANQPVMAIGGFIGQDKVLTLNQFKALAHDGSVRYFVVPMGMGMGYINNGNDLSRILSWVTNKGQRVNYGGYGEYQLYDLSDIDQ